MTVTPNEAIQTILKQVYKPKFEIVPIENALTRIIAQDVFATENLPKYNTPSMDGYAIRFEDKNNKIKVVNTILAGENKDITLNQNECVKVMTGSKIPVNCDCVVPFEDAILDEKEQIIVQKELRHNQHIRFISEDIKKDSKLIEIGQTINFSIITLLTSLGLSHIKVFKKPKIVVFGSGEELKLHYENSQSHQIYNSNTPTLIARCKELGCDVEFIGQAKDSLISIKEHITNSLDANLIITTGGISVGEADFTKEAFYSLGFKPLFEGIIIKPGKPTTFGRIENTLILNLPGNPHATSLIFELFGTILLQKLKGSNEFYHNYITTKISQPLVNKSDRTSLIAGYFDGEYFTPSEKNGTGMVSILANCNSMIVLDKSVEELKTNNLVKILPINWKLFSKKQKDYFTYN